MDLAIASILILLITFFLGSIPFGVIISRLFFKKDIRNEGSGNIGTTNAMRSLGKIGGGAVFILDFGKGLLSGFLGTVFAGMTAPLSGYEAGQLVVALSFFGCVVGHIYSPWLKFHGGKGIAVAIGALLRVRATVRRVRTGDLRGARGRDALRFGGLDRVGACLPVLRVLSLLA